MLFFLNCMTLIIYREKKKRIDKNYVGPSKKVFREIFEIKLTNSSKNTLNLEIEDSVFRHTRWEINTTDTYVPVDIDLIRWKVTLDAASEKKINYTVTYNWEDTEPPTSTTEAPQPELHEIKTANPSYNQPEISSATSAANTGSLFNMFSSKKR